MKKSLFREPSPAVLISIGIAIVLIVAWFLTRAYILAAYEVPTTSMEKSIRRGGKVLVSKLNYLPISRGDIIVFHFPVGDTVIDLPDYQSARPYYDVIRDLGRGDADAGRRLVLDNPTEYPLSIRPISKRESYLKRCIAIPGDTVEMRDELLFINGRQLAWPEEAQTYFYVDLGSHILDADVMKKQYDVDLSNGEDVRPLDSSGKYMMLLTWKARAAMMKDGFARQIVPEIDPSSDGVFPYDVAHHWSRDNYGPLWIPKKDESITLTPLNYPIYERIIRTYEDNKLEMRGGKIYLNGQEASKYTFKMNYYWAIGDNLHGSQDSRYWGFVPEDHLIGKGTTIL